MEPRSTSRLTSFNALMPPKRIIRCSTRKMASLMAPPLAFGEAGAADAHQPARTPDHHRHHQHAEQQHPVFREAAQQPGATVSTKAASTTPRVDPMPPNTTIAGISADSKKVNEVGLTKP